jgi:hypothetical protein
MELRQAGWPALLASPAMRNAVENFWLCFNGGMAGYRACETCRAWQGRLIGEKRCRSLGKQRTLPRRGFPGWPSALPLHHCAVMLATAAAASRQTGFRIRPQRRQGHIAGKYQ